MSIFGHHWPWSSWLWFRKTLFHLFVENQLLCLFSLREIFPGKGRFQQGIFQKYQADWFNGVKHYVCWSQHYAWCCQHFAWCSRDFLRYGQHFDWCAWYFECPTPIFWNFLKAFLEFSKGKNTLFSKVLKNWSSCQKTDYHFLGGGADPKVIKIT